MKLLYKIWLGIGVALLATLVVMAGFGYQTARQNVEIALLEEGRTLHGVLMAMRRTYQRQFLTSGLPLDDKTVGFLPAHSMPRIAKDFEVYDRRGIRFNNVSDRPRNPGNRADAVEMEAIRHFRAHPGDKERLTTYTDAAGVRYFFYATPIWIESSCLKCHGDPADAPPSIRTRYQEGWDYRVGELRGVLSVKLPAEAAEARILGSWRREQMEHMGIIAIALLVGGGMVHWFVVRRLTRLQEGVKRLAAGEYDYRVPEKGTDETTGLARGLNEMARTIQQGRDSMRLAASVFENAREGILIADSQGAILEINQAFSDITGWQREEVQGKNPRMFHSGRHDAAFYTEMWRALREEDHWVGEIWNRRKNGEIYPQRLSIAAVRNDPGEVTHYVGVFSDISLVKRQEQQLEYIAHHDALTGVPNRVLLADRMRQAIIQSRRSGDLLAVGYLDLDGFKPVNDTYGHEAGDRLLVEMARRMTQTLRGGDTVARLGGDEFVFLLQGLKDREECETTLDRLLAAIAQPVNLNGGTVELSASIGMTLFPADDGDPDTLIRHADQAMYSAKQAGRNRCHFHSPEGGPPRP